MIKEYVCKFEAFGKKDELVFEIVENELTRDWSSLIEYHFNKGEKYPQQFVNDYGDNKQEIFEKMKQLAYDIGLTYNYTYDNFTSESLNRLHEEFHFREEQDRQGKYAEKYHQLNLFIHKMERISPVCQWYTHKKLDKIIPIKNDCWQYFDIQGKQLNINKPHISLGYHTIGKDLLNCYFNNDVELVKKGGVRPIQNLHTQVVYTRERIAANVKKSIRKWAKANNINHLIDWNDPSMSRNQRNPLLGYAKKTDANKADMLWKYWEFKEIDIH